MQGPLSDFSPVLRRNKSSLARSLARIAIDGSAPTSPRRFSHPPLLLRRRQSLLRPASAASSQTLLAPPPPPPSPSTPASRPYPDPRFPHQLAGEFEIFICDKFVIYTILCFRGTAMTMKKMLETFYPGIDVVLSNYPPAFPKRVLSKVVPVLQIGVVAVITAGDQIFPRLGMVPPPWYYTLRANRFGSMASAWLLGNFLQSSLQSSGAFEVYCDGALVFSKLQEQRFPSEYELKDLIEKRLPGSSFGSNPGRVVFILQLVNILAEILGVNSFRLAFKSSDQMDQNRVAVRSIPMRL
ncbi:hypothetical protein ZIOFF_030071 [Zingiber officinale]|uniref:SelT-like protein n=1 Tax=Zingiber officinale TaxID=94328 RepID=A0A8J5GNS7_ZINOF|nr:hypothetical protein ZIOFF_030071 [Zingiber officinale]